jgi:nanoRNase/pAp phosphatase (c-di-AMP/oligoRNAs hydrolase)
MKVLVLTDNDLDGAGSALAIKLIYKNKANIEIREVYEPAITLTTLSDYLPHLDTYDKIYITDIYIADNIFSLIDRENVVIIDHHSDHVEVKERYKNAKIIIELYSSCTQLIADKFKSVNFSEEQKLLFRIVNDYDSYELAYADTLKLSAIYYTYNRPKVDKFISSFEDGIRNFNNLELNAVKLYFNKFKDQINTTFFTGTLKNYKVVGCMATVAINEVAHYALKKYNADIAFVVNAEFGYVSFRRSKQCDAKLNILASKLCEGGGHEYAAGGKLTPQFLELTKSFSPC